MEPCNECSQTLSVGFDDALVESGLAQVLPDVSLRLAVGFLRLRLKVDVREHSAAQVVACPEHVKTDFGVHPIDVAAHPWLKRHVAIRLHQQWVEEHLAELPITDPR